jgi:hypothetical protein
LTFFITRSIEVLRQFNPECPYKDINDIIELNNIKRYFDNEMIPPTWTTEEKKLYTSKVKQFPTVIGTYLGMVCDDNILAVIDTVNLQYSTAFGISQ